MKIKYVKLYNLEPPGWFGFEAYQGSDTTSFRKYELGYNEFYNIIDIDFYITKNVSVTNKNKNNFKLIRIRIEALNNNEN
jgi:hypothetical protein